MQLLGTPNSTPSTPTCRASEVTKGQDLHRTGMNPPHGRDECYGQLHLYNNSNSNQDKVNGNGRVKSCMAIEAATRPRSRKRQKKD